MTFNIVQTITNILNEKREVTSSFSTEAYVLYPAPGKKLKNVKTGKTFVSSVNIGSKGKLKDFIEIDLED